MLNNISNEDLVLNNSLIQQTKLAGVDKKTSSQNPYAKTAELGDIIDISSKAKELYEKEQEIEKYKSMVLDMLDSPDDAEQNQNIVDIISDGKYISNADLAQKMVDGKLSLNGSDLLDILLSPDVEVGLVGMPDAEL
jgi:hypothetical protein